MMKRLGVMVCLVLLVAGCAPQKSTAEVDPAQPTQPTVEETADAPTQTCRRLWGPDASGVATEVVTFVGELEQSESIDIVREELEAQVRELQRISGDADARFTEPIEEFLVPLTESLGAEERGGQMSYNPQSFKEAAQFLFDECFPGATGDGGDATAGGTELSQCEEDFAAAAAVPLTRTNDTELDATLYSCGSAAEWKQVLRKYPDVMGLPDPTADEISLALELACTNTRGDSPIC